MKISVNDVEWLASELEEQLDAGNKWAVYECDGPDQEFQHVHLYNDEDKALDFCASVNEEEAKVRLQETKILQKLMENLYERDKHRDDIDYYIIDDLSLVASIVLKTNPDQNSLHDPDGNGFTDELIMHVERQDRHRTSQDLLVWEENFDPIRIQLNSQGYDPDFFVTLYASMLNGASKHEERYFDQFDGDTIMYNHLFNKNSDGSYSLDNISGTLYSVQDIDHLTINGIDTKELEMKMSQRSWGINGYRFIIPHEDILRQLSEDPNGRLIAVKLYNNYVPHWLDKPEFISRIEDELRVYPKMDFPGETKANEIYWSLSSYREISTMMRQFSIAEAQDAKSMAAMIEKLVKSESCCVVAPQGQRQGDDVVLNWDNFSKVLSFEFKDAPKLDAREYFEKNHSAQSESMRKERYDDGKKSTEPGGKLITKLRSNKDKGMSL